MEEPNFNNLTIKKEDIDVIVYHANCDDGFGAAYCAYKYFNKYHQDKQVKYIPLSYSSDIPFNEFRNKNVCVFDFSFKEHDTTEIIKISNSFAVIDHHKTAITELKNIPDKYKTIIMEYSGAYLAWKYFFPEDNVPKLIQYIQDNDIWTKKLPMTLEYTAYKSSINNTFEEFDRLSDDEELMNCIKFNGKIIKEQNDVAIKSIVDHTCPIFMTIGKIHYMVAHINSNIYRSDVGNQTLKKFKYCNFSAVYSINNYNNTTNFSLRSTEDRTDVSLIAQMFNGGGHRNASGMVINMITPNIPGIIHDKFDIYNNLRNIYFSKYDDVTVVNINASTHKQVLSEYLLQPRYYQKNGIPLQECIYIYQTENNNENTYNYCDMSAVWHYDGINDMTLVTVMFDTLMADRKKALIMSKIKSDISYIKNTKYTSNVLMFKGIKNHI